MAGQSLFANAGTNLVDWATGKEDLPLDIYHLIVGGLFTGPNQDPGTILADIAKEGQKAGAAPAEIVAWQTEAAQMYKDETGTTLPNQPGTENLPAGLRPGLDLTPVYWILGVGLGSIVAVQLVK